MSASTAGTRTPLGRRFLVVWAGQTVSAVGSTISGIGVAVYVFVETGDARALGLLSALAAVPYVMAGPFTKHVDRVPRRSAMVAADVVAAAGSVVALVLAVLGRLEIWHLVVAGFLGGLGNAFQFPAWQASIPALAPREALDRANGLAQFGPALGVVVGPAVATPLVHWFGVVAVLVVDLVTFAVAVVATLAVHFAEAVDPDTTSAGSETPDPSGERAGARRDDGSWRSAARWLRGSGRPVVGLLVLIAGVNFVVAWSNVGMLVVATDVGGPAQAGLVLGTGGVGMLAGSVVAGRRGVAADRVLTIARGFGVFAVGCALLAARPSFWLVVVGAFVALVPVPALGAAIATLFHEHVPSSMQGRVFGLRIAVGRSLEPVGALAAGLVITDLAGPAMADGGVLAGSLGAVLGRGDERGAALVVLIAGASIAAVGVWLAGSATRRRLAPAPPSAPPQVAVAGA